MLRPASSNEPMGGHEEGRMAGTSSIRSNEPRNEAASEGLVQNTSKAKSVPQEQHRVDVTFDGAALHGIVRDLFPLTRSITGDGLRETLARIDRFVPLNLHEIPTGTPALDWEIPQEWNIRSARIETLDGRVVVNFAESNLHVVGYSTPIDREISRDELASHVHTLPDQPTLIPYRTGYYAQDWGFCIPDATWKQMTVRPTGSSSTRRSRPARSPTAKS